MKKITNKQLLSFVIVLIGILSLFGGTSYAILKGSTTANNEQIIKAGSVELKLTENYESIDKKIMVMSDSNGLLQSDVYEFNIKNIGASAAKYDLKLTNEAPGDFTGNLLSSEYIKIGLEINGEEFGPMSLSEVNSVIDKNTIYPNEVIVYKLRIWLDSSKEAELATMTDYKAFFKLGVEAEQRLYDNLDRSGANIPVLSKNMIPVYYDETEEVWKKADSNNSSETYKWYDYDNKMWANSVTVSEINRSTYLNASLGTEIPMDDILTMQVWIPRYKYKVFNYNADGTATSEPQEINITFEEGTATTGEISCTDSISGTDGDQSETCKLKSTNGTCTDSTCNGKTYTHPAFTFGDTELKGVWVGKFEVSAPTDSTCYTSASTTNCNKTGITPLVKPDVMSYRYAQVGTFETNMMAMNDSGNKYGFSASDDTHMMKNQEWGAVAYLSHSKYGTCTDGTCTEININNSSSHYTGRSGGSARASYTADGTYKYNDIYDGTTTLTGGTTITPTITNDTTYPWTETSGLYKSSTQGVDSSTTNLTFSFTTLSDNTYLSFDWSVSSESASYDYIYYTITKDGTALSDTGTSTKIGGTSLGTTEDALTYKSVSRKLEAGSYEITFTYKKDISSAKGTDTGYVKNIKILDNPTVDTELTPIGEGKDGPSASTTGNIYGIYDMSGGAYEYVMGNMVSKDGTTMMSGINSSDNSGYSGIVTNEKVLVFNFHYTDDDGNNEYVYLSNTNDDGDYIPYTGTYTYPENKYLDKYSFGTSDTQRIRSKLGDAVKEVYNTGDYYSWYSDYSDLVYSGYSWFIRGGFFESGSSAGVFRSDGHYGNDDYVRSSRLVITP